MLATHSTVFQDKPHFEFGIVPGDGVNLLWPEVIDSVRGRYFILTRQELGVETAKEWGAVNEIVPADKLLARAREIAEQIAPPHSALAAPRPTRPHPIDLPDLKRDRSAEHTPIVDRLHQELMR